MGDANKTNTSESTPTGPGPKPPKAAKHFIQAPKGTRDLYPQDAALRRFITEHWRNASVRHGFEEIDGPTFEDANLYKVKSGEGILAEVFGVFSGKSPEDVEAVRDPERGPPYVLRPEFTPTLARMYAARAAQLPKPTKWFTSGPFFRAERPQRGRLREFLQWNVDFIGLESPQPHWPDVPISTNPYDPFDPESFARARADAECIANCIDLLASLGLSSSDMSVRFSDRRIIADVIEQTGVAQENVPHAFALLDRREKIGEDAFHDGAQKLGWRIDEFLHSASTIEMLFNQRDGVSTGTHSGITKQFDLRGAVYLSDLLHHLGVGNWCRFSTSIVRGLAYYTGMVFEVIADGERAVAGGGRYDNLIELFGGPPTPAVGFGMGDVVLANLLRDKDLLPANLTPPPPARTTPDAYVITPDPALDPLVRQLVATLRQGAPAGGMVAALGSHAIAQSRPLHARHSYKSTRNVGKLLKDAADARYAVILESPTDATIKDMATGQQHWCPPTAVATWLQAALAIHH